jgi:hypothetical protein
MSPAGRAPKATTSNMPSMTTRRSSSIADQEPPAKRPRLKLNLRKPSSNDGDTIAVSRPKRASAARSLYSEDVVMLDDEVEETQVKQSPAASSELSSPISVTASVRSGMLTIKNTKHEAQESSDEELMVDSRQEDELEAAESSDEEVQTMEFTKETRREVRESYGDFMSYYVADGDDDEEEAVPNPKPKRQPAKSKPAAKEKQPRQPRKKQASTPLPTSVSPVTSKPSPVARASKAPKQSVRQYPPPEKVRTPRAKPVGHYGLPQAPPLGHAQSNQRLSPAQHATHASNGRQHPDVMHQPNGMHHSNGMHGMQPHQAVQPPKPYTLLAEVITVKYHASVDEKVKKLQTLSASLTVFGGGVPPPRETPAPASGKAPETAKKVEDVQTKQDEKKEAKGNGQFLARFSDARRTDFSH